VLIITQKGILIRLKVKDIRETGRAAMGVKLIDLDPEDRVVAVAKLAEREDADEDEVPPTLLPPPDSAPFLKDDA
jgi:DNA gyrase subunit A